MEEKVNKKDDYKQREFFKDYKTAIPFLKEVFYYGTMSQQDFEDEGICGHEKYNNLKNTLQYVFGDILLTESKNSNGKKALSLRIDHFYDPHQAFLRFFALKSFTNIQRLFRICFILRQIQQDGKCSLDDIITEISLNDNSENNNNDISSTIRRLVNEMHDQGFLIKKGKYYFLSDSSNILNNDKLLLLTDLCTNIYPLSICGSGIQNKMDSRYQSPFLIKHRNLGQVFNDELIWKLLIFIHYKQHISITRVDESKLRDLLPYRIITNKETGRQYLFAIYIGTEDYDEYLLLRLDKILEVNAEDIPCTVPDEEILHEKYETAFKYSFNGTTIIERDKEPQKGTLIYNKSFEWNIKKHFRDCDPVSVDETNNKVRIKVNSLTELKPWLRKHMDKVRLTESSDNTVEEMQSELKKWKEMYEIN